MLEKITYIYGNWSINQTHIAMNKLLRLFLLMLVSSMLMSTQLNAQTILCVDRDFSDTAIGFTDTWGPISRALDAGGYLYDYWEVLPDDDDGPPY